MSFTAQAHDKNDLPAVALGYIRQGIAIFPLRPHGKTPLTAHGLKDASTDPAVVTAWWQQWPEANIGIVTGGKASFWVLDIDGAEGENTLSALEEKYGALPQTVEVITGGGGRHLYFQYPQQGAIFNSAGRLGLCLDVRGNGGYVVAPPSIHETGRRYEFSVDSHDWILPAPAWLVDLVQRPEGKKSAVPVSEWLNLAKGVIEGQRNSSLARLAGKLLQCGFDPLMTLELCHAWNEARCKPPLEQAEVTRTVNSIAGRELARRGG
jgi:hypothetical protein